jgi:phosphoribosyl 1,2-cyclic phosphodiesterase
MEFAILATGSRGNSLVVRTERGALLVDAGLSARETTKRLRRVGVPPDQVRGLLLSHAHADHIRGATRLARSFGWEVYGTPSTLGWLDLGEDDGVRVRSVRVDARFEVGSFEVHAYPVPHDAPEAVQFVIRSGRRTLALATDLGTVTAKVGQSVAGAGALLLEANHDRRMLWEGRYPDRLKRRIAGAQGHLSNDDAGAFLATMGDGTPRVVVLGHLSENNNRPDIAYRTVAGFLTRNVRRPETLAVVPQRTLGGWFEVPETSPPAT